MNTKTEANNLGLFEAITVLAGCAERPPYNS